MKIKKIVKKVASVLCVCLVVLEILVITIIVASKMSGGVPSVLGYNMYVIASPSMSPELEIGDVIISKAYDGGDLEVGDVVQFVSRSGETQGKIILRIYTSQTTMANRINKYVLDKNIIHR